MDATNLAEFVLSRLIDDEHEGALDAPGSPWQDVACPAIANIDLLPFLVVTALPNHLPTSQLHRLFHHRVVKHSKQHGILCQGSSHLTQHIAMMLN